MPAPVATTAANTALRSSIASAKAAMGVANGRALSTRATQVLSAIGLPTNDQVIPGVFDGTWGGSGEVIETKCPATGEVLARVQTVSERNSSKLTVGHRRRDSSGDRQV